VVKLKQVRLFLHSSLRETGSRSADNGAIAQAGPTGLLEAEQEELLPDRPAGVRGVEFSGRTRTFVKPRRPAREPSCPAIRPLVYGVQF